MPSNCCSGPSILPHLWCAQALDESTGLCGYFWTDVRHAGCLTQTQRSALSMEGKIGTLLW